MADITNAQLRATLPTGVTLGATEFPDSDSALKTIALLLDAFQSAQSAQNAANSTAGEDINAITVGNGLQTTITRDSTTYTVVPRIYTVSLFLQQLVGDAFAPQV